MDTVTITCISNITFEPNLVPYIKQEFLLRKKKVDFLYIPYEEVVMPIDTLSKTTYIVVCINFETLYPNAVNDIASKNDLGDVVYDTIVRCQTLYDSIRQYSIAPILWFGFEDYSFQHDSICGTLSPMECLVDRLNISLFDMLRENDTYIDMKRLIAKCGIKLSIDSKGKYRWNAPYSKELVHIMAREIYRQYLIHLGNTKKCLVLDCDNVLWGGTLSDDGIEKIKLASYGSGKPYQDFQRLVLWLYKHGVILAVCSKNDEKDVRQVFNNHSGMLLKEKHISCFECNWDNKYENIQAIANFLNIGLDSIVFVDDSEFEINSVNSIIPEVTAILYNRDTIYEDLSCFNLRTKYDSASIAKRTETYQANIERAKLQATAMSFEQYLLSLDMRIDCHKALPEEIARVAELTQRTNKCTNGIRYTIEEIKKRYNGDDHALYTISITDRFSDLGVVGVIGIYNRILDLFVLSCRALGRKIEEAMLEYVKSFGVNEVLFISTGKNASVKELISHFGFKLITRK